MRTLSRHLRNSAKKALHRLFLAGQAGGWDVLPRHFYSSIPDVRHLRATSYWRRPLPMAGVSGAGLDHQLEVLHHCCPPEVRRRTLASSIHQYASRQNGEEGYGVIEADFLFGFISTLRPPQIVQIGGGVSTAVILLAAEESHFQPEVVCIDPFPTAYLRRLARENRIRLIPETAQTVDLKYFGLNAGDLLFIDSTHTVKPGSEVNRVILEILPDLPTGCYVHFHDIYFPYDYPPSLLSTLFFGGESTLLHAFLIHNRRYRIGVSLSMLHHLAPQALAQVLPNYRKAPMQDGLHLHASGLDGHFPSATYLGVCGMRDRPLSDGRSRNARAVRALTDVREPARVGRNTIQNRFPQASDWIPLVLPDQERKRRAAGVWVADLHAERPCPLP